ncbi:hypothetical protein AG1IA_04792 [Rhizoctonia solani AG-1 IA]|uniref:Uncharacterized protein n=1 Tax=Thanatephorus cucumeris (strain AG1-IA) TaxID=983506 RepID=L8WWL4_THACA|nr:hypothetical protein AG1IA_04792 [Rhizoctonia solani AG-1 IA]
MIRITTHPSCQRGSSCNYRAEFYVYTYKETHLDGTSVYENRRVGKGAVEPRPTMWAGYTRSKKEEEERVGDEVVRGARGRDINY